MSKKHTFNPHVFAFLWEPCKKRNCPFCNQSPSIYYYFFFHLMPAVPMPALGCGPPTEILLSNSQQKLFNCMFHLFPFLCCLYKVMFIGMYMFYIYINFYFLNDHTSFCCVCTNRYFISFQLLFYIFLCSFQEIWSLKSNVCQQHQH